MAVRVLVGDCRQMLATLPEQSVQTCVTSPPYFGLRDYGHAGQIGLEPTPDAFVAELVAVFREVRRVLRDDGTLWLNLGDSYAGSWGAQGRPGEGCRMGSNYTVSTRPAKKGARRGSGADYKTKDLIGIPWMVAFALRSDGWYLRSDIIWHKPNPMPESVTDRPTKAHEYLFLLSKSPTYYYDADAIREPHTGPMTERRLEVGYERQGIKLASARDGGEGFVHPPNPAGRNRRTVWTVATQPYSGAHFATFPPALVEPCILAGSKRGDTVLDPFGGAGTTGLVADRLGRDAILCELNPAYAELARRRITDDAPLFGDVA